MTQGHEHNRHLGVYDLAGSAEASQQLLTNSIAAQQARKRQRRGMAGHGQQQNVIDLVSQSSSELLSPRAMAGKEVSLCCRCNGKGQGAEVLVATDGLQTDCMHLKHSQDSFSQLPRRVP